MKKFVIIYLILLSLCFISFLFTYGYEEGTMHNEIVGKLFSVVFLIFTFPIVSFVTSSQYFIPGLILDVGMYALLISLVFYFLKISKFKSN